MNHGLTTTNSQSENGFKQTAIGVIPKDWVTTNLGGFISLQRGYDLPHRDRKAGDIPIITSSGFGDTHSEAKASGPGVVTGRYGTIGDVFYVEKDFWPLNTTLYVKNFHGNNPLFSSYLLKTIDFHSHSGKSGVPGVNRNDLHEILVCIPPSKEEQEAIAHALSDIDALIESLDRLLTKKRQIKQGAMQELLMGRRRLDGFGEKIVNYKQSKMGLIPSDWEQIEIGSSIDMLTGFPFSSSGYSLSGIRLLRGSNVKRGVTEWSEEDTKYWPSISHDIKQYLLQDKDIVIAMDGSLVGRSFAMLSESDLPAVLLQRVARIRSNIINQGFLKEWICSQYFTDHCDAVKTVTAIPHISPDNIRSFSILKPSSIEEQQVIATILSDMDAEIDSIEAKLTKTRQIKQGMMHELLTGRIRLI
jgi:type I restriction enzyme, S subunit